jgi:hypothetical protein
MTRDHGITSSTRRSPGIVRQYRELKAANEWLLMAEGRVKTQGCLSEKVSYTEASTFFGAAA